MSQDPKEMLEQYRAMISPDLKPTVEAYKKMSLAERDELCFFVCLYMAQQYAALLRMIHGMPTTDPPPGKPN